MLRGEKKGPSGNLGRAESWLSPRPKGWIPRAKVSPTCQAYHDPGVVHKLCDGHSLSGLCFQQVPDEHLHCGVGQGTETAQGPLSVSCSFPHISGRNQGRGSVAWGPTAHGASQRTITLPHLTGPSHRQPDPRLTTYMRRCPHTPARVHTNTHGHAHVGSVPSSDTSDHSGLGNSYWPIRMRLFMPGEMARPWLE